ncbi:hypothetical protein JO40_04165 [Treponema putidum]|nr:hypothetical protein JO40_04165 [Treponema putidum]
MIYPQSKGSYKNINFLKIRWSKNKKEDSLKRRIMSESSEKQCVSFVCCQSILEKEKNVKHFFPKYLKIKH